jgi:hypothetical protein
MNPPNRQLREQLQAVQDSGGNVTASLKGYWAAIKIRDGDIWKMRMEAWNLIPS